MRNNQNPGHDTQLTHSLSEASATHVLYASAGCPDVDHPEIRQTPKVVPRCLVRIADRIISRHSMISGPRQNSSREREARRQAPSFSNHLSPTV